MIYTLSPAFTPKAKIYPLKSIPGSHVQPMREAISCISHGLEGGFEHDMRRAVTPEDFCGFAASLSALLPTGWQLFCDFEAQRPG